MSVLAGQPPGRPPGRFWGPAALPLTLGRLALDPWALGALAVAGFVAAPLLAVIWQALATSDDIWSHLAATVLPVYIRETLLLMTGVGVGTFIVGTGCAWLVTMCRFPGQRVLTWALLLPFAVPAYLLAFVATDQLEYAGTVQTGLRALFGWQRPGDYWFPEIRSLGGAVWVMTLALYPYVYLLARAAFLEQSVCVLEVSRTLGKTAWGSFFGVALPLARPAIVIGISLVLMETLNDFGTVDFFAVETFTVGIYDVWLNQSSIAGAAQLSLVLMVFVLALITAERLARRGRRFHHTSSRYQNLPSYRLTGLKAVLAFAACVMPVVIGFVIPALVLAGYAVRFHAETLSPRYLEFAANSLGLSAFAAIAAAVIGLVLAYAQRLSQHPAVNGVVRFAGIGYAVPASVLAVGVILPLARLDQAVDGAAMTLWGIPAPLLVSGTLAAVVYGYLVRFLALSHGAVEAGLTKVTPNMDGAARTLGAGPGGALKRVHFPLIRGSLMTAALLVFVDCMKELPLTLVLRPFDFDTLATFVYQYASDELFEEASLAALTIVAAGILPVILLSMTIVASRRGGTAP